VSAPPGLIIRIALETAARSPCRSKRGVVLYDPVTGVWRGSGYNGPPLGGACPGRDICAGSCGQRSVHAEVRALRNATRGRHTEERLDLVHVERAGDGAVVACDGPRCWQCSREILDVGFVGGVWLYEAVPEEHCPHLPEERRIDCVYCQGEACRECAVFSAGCRLRTCGHDVLDRHGTLPVISARWRRYTVEEFHIATLANCGIRR
jgi:deoxycytidylate deaminase